MKRVIKLAQTVLLCLLVSNVFSQKLNSIQGASPQTANSSSALKAASSSEDLSTGTAQNTLPVTSIGVDGVEIPISLNYASTGIRVGEYASWVGLGWHLSGPISIMRSVRNAPDEGHTQYYSSNYAGDEWVNYSGWYENPNPQFIDENNINVNYTTKPDLGSANGSYTVVDSHDKRTTACRSMTDTESDAYTVNLPGKSISFYFTSEVDNNGKAKIKTIPANLPVKIEVDYSYNTFTKWVIIDENGIEYYFGKGDDGISYIDRVRSFGENVLDDFEQTQIYPVTTAWHCTKIITPNAKKEITFSYKAQSYRNGDLGGEFAFKKSIADETNVSNNETLNTLGNSCPYNPYNLTSFQKLTFSDINDYILLSITAENKTIYFNSNTVRNDHANDIGSWNGYHELYGMSPPSVDIGGPYLLDDIEVQVNGICIERYGLDYLEHTSGNEGWDDSDFNDTDNDSMPDLIQDKVHYFLDSFSKTSCNLNSTASLEHSFEYYLNDYGNAGVKMPRRLSFARDYSGLYNGKNAQRSLIPSTIDEFGNGKCQIPNGIYPYYNDRSPSFPQMQYGILKKINLPTGGSTQYKYEANEIEAENIFETSVLATSYPIGKDVFTVNQAQIAVALNINLGYGCTFDPITGWANATANITVNEVNPDGTTGILIHEFTEVGKSITITKNLNLEENKTYKVIVQEECGLGSFKVVEKYEADKINYGGLRLKQKIVEDGDGDLDDDQIINYEYNFSSIEDEENGIQAATTGKMSYSLIPNADRVHFFKNSNDFYSYVQRSSRVDPFNVSRPLIYQYVKVKQQGVDGFTLHEYGVPNQSFTNGYNFINNKVLTQRKYGVNAPNGHIINNSPNYIKWGLPMQTVVYDSSFEEVAKTEYDYSIIEDGESIEGVQWDLFYSNFDPQNKLKRMLCIPYTIKTGYPQLNSVTSTQDGISVKQKYTYHNTYPTLVAKVENLTNGTATNSSQEEYFYPIDFQNSTELSANAQAAIDLMIARNMIAPKIEFKKYDLDFGTSQVYEGNRTDFKIHTNTQGAQVVVPELVKVYQQGNLNIKNRFANFNDDGVPLKTYTAKFGATDQDAVTNAARYDQTPVEVTFNSNDFLSHRTIGGRVTQFFDDDGDNRVDRTIDYNSIESTVEYDDIGRVKAETKNNGDIRIDYRVTLNIDAPGIGKTNQYVKTTSFPNDNSIKDQQNRVFKDGLNRVINEISDAYNLESGNPNVTQKTITYDTAGRADTETNALGVTSTYVYSNSPLSRVEEVITPVGTSTTSIGVNTQALVLNNRTYQVKSLIKKNVVDVDGKETVTYQDHLNRQVKAVEFNDGNELVTTYEFDQYGSLTKCKPPMGDSYLYTYDANGLLSSKTVPAQGITLFRYDELGRQVAVTDAKGNNFVYVYDGYERKTKSGLYEGTIPTNITYFGTGANALQPTQVLQETIFDGFKDWVLEDKEHDQKTNQILTTTFLNDGFGRQKTITQPNHLNGTDVRTFTYNDAGQPLTQTHQHGANSLLSNSISNSWSYHYDDNQRETGISFNGQRLNKLVYNKFDQLEKRKLHLNADATYLQTVDYRYDDLGRLTHINDIEAQPEDGTIAAKLCTETVNFIAYQNPSISKLTRYKDGLEVEMPLQNTSFGLSQQAIDAYIVSFKNDLQNEGIIFDDVEIFTQPNDNDQSVTVSISILQTNASFAKIITAGNGIDKPEIDRFNKNNCCGTTESYDLFAERIEYDGNQIKFNEWQVAGGQFQSYNYRYDDLNRLRFANYAYRNSYGDTPTGDGDFWPTNTNPQTGRYSTQYQYDDIGNITKLYRKGVVSSIDKFVYGAIDALAYNYNDANGNYKGQLQSITESSSTTRGFKSSSSNYTYDNNGNLYTDTGKGIIANHNYLNLPQTIHKGINRFIQMHYSGTGSLVQRQYVDNSTNTTINKDYIGEIEYLDGELMGINHEEGRIRLVEQNGQLKPVFEYSIKDYKGSNRITFTDNNLNGTVFNEDMLQENHYYPYGMEMEGDFLGASTPEFPLQYGGMDLVRELELDVYFTKYRTLDPTIGRWWQADPKAEDFVNRTPYNSMNNNPVIFVDPDGDAAFLVLFVAFKATIDVIQILQNTQLNGWEKAAVGLAYVGISIGVSLLVPSSSEILGASLKKAVGLTLKHFGVNALGNLAKTALLNESFYSKGGNTGTFDNSDGERKGGNYLEAIAQAGASTLSLLAGAGIQAGFKGLGNLVNKSGAKWVQNINRGTFNFCNSKVICHFKQNQRAYSEAINAVWSIRNTLGKRHFKKTGVKWKGATEGHSFSWYLWKRYTWKAIDGGSAKDNWWLRYSY